MTLMNVTGPIPQDNESPVDPQGSQKISTPALLFEMMRSFVTLARTLNLSHAVNELGSTRQTLRRHIAQLETTSGGKLFTVHDRQYHLTDHALEMLPEAEELLSRGTLWSTGKTRHFNDLLSFSHETPNGWSYYQQHQPLSHVWDRQSPLLRRAITAWSLANGDLEHEAFQEIRPYVLVYRDSDHGWLCVEIGEDSFYVNWWGWVNARSSIGRSLGSLPGGPEFENLLNKSFNEVKAHGGLHLDEVVTQIPRRPEGTPEPLAYQRLLLGGRFPDGSFALIAVVDRSEKIRINGLNQAVLEQMPADATVSFKE